jgi:hypothetical protein
MVRRKPRPYRPIINDAAELVDSQTGAIVVYVPDQFRDSICIITHLGYAHTAVFEDRFIKRRSYTCAVVAHVKPGTARLECSATKRRAEVTVEAGRVCQVDWRHQA